MGTLRRVASGTPIGAGPPLLLVCGGQSQLIHTGLPRTVAVADEDAGITYTALNAAITPATPGYATVYAGAWLAAARYLAARGPTVGVVGGAVGGSQVGSWQKGQTNYDAMLAAAQAAVTALDVPVAAYLFAQGESDARGDQPGVHPTDWAAYFARMVADLRADLGQPDLPVLFSPIAHTTRTDVYTAWATVRAQQAVAAAAVANVVLVESEPVVLRSDGVHYDDDTWDRIGRSYAAALLGH